MIGNITLSGILIDSTGKAIAGAKVVLKSVKTGDVISGLAGSFTTGADGSYSVNVPYGSYKVYVEIEGEQTAMPGFFNVYDYSANGSLQDFLYQPCEENNIPMFLFELEVIRQKIKLDYKNAVDDVRDNLIPLGKQYATLSEVESDLQNIPDGATAYYRGDDENFIAIEVINNGGVLEETGRTMPAGGNILQNKSSSNLVEFSDVIGFTHSRIKSDGTFETPMSKLGENEISSGNLSLSLNAVSKDDTLMLSDGLGFYIPVNEKSDSSSPEPGEVTVDLPPQTAAYGLLSKMRAALEDVCIIINSDSTGITQDTDPSTGQVFKKWTRKLAEFLAGNYPAYTVNYYSWSSNAYTTPETIQIGTAGKTLHFYNAAVAGTQPLYLMGQYFEAAYVPRQADLIIFNHGHNTDNNVPASTHMGMDLAIVYTMLQRHPNAGAIVVSQNPLRDNDNGTVRSNGARQAAITAGFSLVDAFQLFQNAGKPSSWYMDNIHPNATGDAKIFDLVKNLFVWPASPSRFIPGLEAGTNLLTNADFSTWTNGLDAPDGWSLTGCTAEKDTTNFESGDYGLRLNQTGTIETYAAKSLPAALVKRLRGKTVVLAARVFVPSTSTRGNCGSIQIPEITNNRPYGTPSGGRGGFIWKATIVTIPLNATIISVRLVLDTSGGVAGNWCSFDRVSLTLGNIPQDFY